MKISIQVPTPNGLRHHGEIRDKSFVRKVRKSKDLMRMFDAWSLHPEALKKLQELKIESIKYWDEENNELWVTNRKHWEEDAFKKTYGGGETLYLKLEFWHNVNNEQQVLF